MLEASAGPRGIAITTGCFLSTGRLLGGVMVEQLLAEDLSSCRFFEPVSAMDVFSGVLWAWNSLRLTKPGPPGLMLYIPCKGCGETLPHLTG